ncbi:hypothetical protein [Ornithinimicrobium kibberense]
MCATRSRTTPPATTCWVSAGAAADWRRRTLTRASSSSTRKGLAR